ncbi:hypothetical protein A2673_03285 [Candidatus Kaiserbacteria bacterium RIFCSPHIGHO2_01_FULL_50_13]|uniref:Cell division protein FtsA n=1 Tax=Candidatus Kaiserbacteria bacterium RIFCSPLOWO2_01_FULL_50_24 TaxID=1798507 RepID=A0A1F6EIT7_9BACT|nr:MAG: hypothetical protein A2673_03285 [Candidatus Kaiserbacteria bacterium RIFCSPHIGHO2_01_FULL_50_13]OGG73528.1 MAG: hypothetical protein A3A34_01125 [Candidatus Kaiserbacteria bacterium RIFCSPLOWO2_01_FULL_50_24]OGG81576.1 MAG: hypothetical protein A3H74_00660 [Candidatus Kaiserbacteria bacterium RIFCSPLOWO2_02_FULL_51_13]
MKRVYAGLDIGTYHVKAAIAAAPATPDVPMQILGTGLATTRGMHRGHVIEVAEVTKAIREAFARAQSAAGVSVRSARVAVGDEGVDETHTTGEVTLTASGGIVTKHDVERVAEESRRRAGQKLINRKSIHMFPIEYRVDGIKVVGKPHGLQGTKLAVDTLIVSMPSKQYEDIISAVEAAGIEVEEGDVIVSPFAASGVTLSKAQKIAGVMLADIGAETISTIVFNEDMPVSVKVFPVGSADVTHRIALAFQISLSEAEQIKKGAVTGSDISPQKVQRVVNEKLKIIFTIINAHLKSIGRQRMLPAGIVITGGGSGLPGVESIAKAVLKLPASIGMPSNLPRSGFADAIWSVTFGLCRLMYMEDMATTPHSLQDVWRQTKEAVRGVVRSLMP